MRRNDRSTVADRYAFLSEIPHPRTPLTEITDNRRVLIENHRGIASYGTQQIRVNAACGYICIQGNYLQLRCITKEKVVVTGHIHAVSFHREA